jgi:predicted dienelactone hydrolase
MPTVTQQIHHVAPHKTVAFRASPRRLPYAVLALLLSAAAAKAGQICDARWTDPARHRTVPVRIRMPDGNGTIPVILFSHGLGGSLDSGTIWAKAWADAGFAVIHLQHPGSDSSVMRRGGLRAAASPQQLVARVADVQFVLDRLERGGREGTCDLGRIDMRHVGMSGHSFGAQTTQAIAGQRFPSDSEAKMADRRVAAAIAFSPSPPATGSVDAAFAAIRIPFFSITGTRDQLPGTHLSPEDRQTPYAAMPPGGKYLLVLDGANHMVFNGADARLRWIRPGPEVQRIVNAATTDFWRWTLSGDMAARRRLDSGNVGLRPADRLAHK